MPAQTFASLFSFDGTDGANPYGGLIQGTDGNLYGTQPGGASGNGSVFKITPNGAFTTLYSFCSQSSCTDGAGPFEPVVQATDGNFYGTTADGGANESSCGGFGCGTVFKVTPRGTLKTLYGFCSQINCTDGEGRFAGLVQATDGNLYGTTELGGANGGGTVFKITAGGTLKTLYSFCSQINCTDGDDPLAGLVQATDGNSYGTTQGGGANGGGGTVFKITPRGMLTTLYSFYSQSGCTDGELPLAGLLQAANGNFYGTTDEGGTDGQGTVFKITPSGNLTTLHSFDHTEGANPFAGLVQATDGNSYGTTQGGGADGYGTVFRITPSGTVTALYSFCSQSDCADGAVSAAALVQDTNGKFYGTTYEGGPSSDCNGGCGTVFSLSIGLRTFVETQPTSGKVGAAVNILGTNLMGATSVTFNGTAATFAFKLPSYITPTVPTGATTGKV